MEILGRGRILPPGYFVESLLLEGPTNNLSPQAQSVKLSHCEKFKTRPTAISPVLLEQYLIKNTKSLRNVLKNSFVHQNILKSTKKVINQRDNRPTDRPTDRQTDRPTNIVTYRVACTRLKRGHRTFNTHSSNIHTIPSWTKRYRINKGPQCELDSEIKVWLDLATKLTIVVVFRSNQA